MHILYIHSIQILSSTGHFIEIYSNGSFVVGEWYENLNYEFNRKYNRYNTDSPSEKYYHIISISGTLQGMRTTVSPSDGPLLLLFAFEAVIIGGTGSFWGTLAGAMLLGVAQQIGFRWDLGWGLWCGHIMFLIF